MSAQKIMITSNLLSKQVFSFPPSIQKEVEAWVVNTLKVRMIKKLDNMLEKEGRDNARKLFLVPLFTILELTKRVEHQAPEMRTLFFRELTATIAETKKT